MFALLKPKPTQLARFVRSSRHLDAEPCRNCGTVYFGNYCNECGQEAYTGAPTTLGFIYEFLTRNIFERGKVPRTLWRLLRHPGMLTVDFLEGRRQRFIRPVRLYFVLSVLYFLLLSMQHSALLKYVKNEAPAAKQGATLLELDMKDKNGSDDKAFEGFVYDKQLSQYQFWGVLKHRILEVGRMPPAQREEVMYQALLSQAPKAMFFLVPVFALLLKGLFVLRRIPYGAHLLFAFNLHSYLFFILLLMLLPLHEGVKVMLGLSVPLHLLVSLRVTYECGWLTSLLRSLGLVMAYTLAIALALLGVLAVGLLL